MSAIDRILCATDFSPASARALQHAMAMARWRNAGLTLLHVSPPLPVVAGNLALALDAATFEARRPEHLRERLADFAAPAVQAGLPTELLVEEGPIVAKILERARAEDSNLIALGTHGRGALGHFVLGSVAERVVRKATCPVLTVGPGPLEMPRLPVALKNIVCAIDLAAPSRRGLAHALWLARQARSRLTLVHALGLPQGRFDSPYAEMVAEGQERLRKETLHELRAAVPAEARAWCDLHERVVMGTPWRQVLRVAEEEKADLLVLDVHDCTAAERAFFGSCADQVVRHASCAVLTVREH
jgi:nucleotide-binding universal stress UspA family protein